MTTEPTHEPLSPEAQALVDRIWRARAKQRRRDMPENENEADKGDGE